MDLDTDAAVWAIHHAQLVAKLLRHGLAFFVVVDGPALFLTVFRTCNEGLFAVFVLEGVLTGIVTPGHIGVGLRLGEMEALQIGAGWNGEARLWLMTVAVASTTLRRLAMAGQLQHGAWGMGPLLPSFDHS